MKFADDMSNEDYHGAKSVSKSTLDMINRDVHLPMWSRKCPQDKEKLKTFDFGDAMHAICLEPDRLKSEFIEMPEFNGRSNAGKEEIKAFKEEHKAKKILTAAEYKQLNLMFESVMAYLPARKLIAAQGHAERSYFWTDERTGLECKCRPDKYLPDQNLLLDVKTAPDLKKFCYSVEDYRYHVQDPWYCDGLSRFDGPQRMEFLVIQKTIEIGRYPVMFVKLPPEIIELGRMEYKNDLMKYAEFMSSEQEPDTLELPIHYRFLDRALESITEVEI